MTLKERIETLKEQREKLVIDANMQIARLSGAIEILETIYSEENGETEPDEGR